MADRFTVYIAIVVIVFAGCAPQIERQMRICPGAESTDELVSVLRGHFDNATTIRANGQCKLQYYIEGKRHKENFPVKLWLNPPDEIYLQGDVAFDPKGLIVGANAEGFWLSLRPKEISGYWWGRWAETEGFEGLIVNPELILEAFGVVDVGRGDGWVLSKEGGFDVLTMKDKGIERRKIYISRCDYLIEKVEYFDTEGKTAVIMELGKYRLISEEYSVPGLIKIISYDEGGEENVLQISLGSVKAAAFTEKQRGRLFNRPEPRGFEHIYKVVGDKVIEQLQ
jgi:hypothetical protein